MKYKEWFYLHQNSHYVSVKSERKDFMEELDNLYKTSIQICIPTPGVTDNKFLQTVCIVKERNIIATDLMGDLCKDGKENSLSLEQFVCPST